MLKTITQNWLLPFFCCAFFTCSISAQNAIQTKKIELYPTYSALSIELAYAGDDNQNAHAEFVWKRESEVKWHNGVDMTFDRKRRLIWASVWPLKQGESIHVKVKLFDADGTGPKLVNAKATIRKLNLQPKGGRTLFVSPKGNDTNPGTKEKPLQTLARAAKQTRPGDIVMVSDGVYREGNLFSGLKGTEEKPIVFMAAPGAKPVIDSAIVIAKNDGNWSREGNDVYAIQTEFDGGYVAQDGLRMFPYPTLADLQKDRLKVKRAWFYDKQKKRLYVRTGTGNPPSKHVYNLSRHSYAIWLTRSTYVVVRGFVMHNYGAAVVRMSEGARGCVLIDNTISNAPGGIFMKSATTRDNVIWRNHIFEPGIPDFSWQAHYAVGYGNQAIYCTKAGRGNSFCYNRIHDYFDLISVESWRNPDRLEYNRDCDIMFNILYNASDDAIEVDGGGVNMRIHGNRIRNCLTAISLAPIERGPVYVTRNDASFRGLMFKFNVNGCTSHGWTFCYHNSGYCLVTGADGGTAISFPTRIPCSNKVLKNNIIVCNEWSVRAGKKGYILDGNCYFNVPGRPPRRFQWGGKVYGTIVQFRNGTGLEKNGMYASPRFSSTPDVGKYPSRGFAPLSEMAVFKDEKIGDLRLQRSSPCIDKAVRIRGMNDDYDGRGPDIGAYEVDS